jgi:hypothetical protein
MHAGPKERQVILLACLALAPFACGCGKDLKAMGDQHVHKDLLDKQQKEPAIPFFEKHGQLFDTDDTSHVDQEIVLPLLKRLQTIAPAEQWVMLRPNKKNAAYALLVKLPGDRRVEDQMAEAIQEADDNFPGLILQQWGHEWLLMDLIDQKSYEYLKKIRPNIDKQRP